MGAMLRVAAMTRAASTKARRLGRDTVVVVVSDLDEPALITALAGGVGGWCTCTAARVDRKQSSV